MGASHADAFWKAGREGTHDLALRATISGASGALATLLTGAAAGKTVGELGIELAVGGAVAGSTFKALSPSPRPAIA